MKNPDHVFADSLSQAQRWLREISEDQALSGWMDDEYALQCLRGALHALRDQLTVEQSAHLSAQLPMVVRGIYYEEWSPAIVPARDRSGERFLKRLSRYFPDKDRTVDPASIARAVFRVLHRHISPGESQKLYHVLPGDIRKLWPARDT